MLHLEQRVFSEIYTGVNPYHLVSHLLSRELFLREGSVYSATLSLNVV